MMVMREGIAALQLLVNFSVFHDKYHRFHGADIFQGVTIHSDKVCCFSGFHRT